MTTLVSVVDVTACTVYGRVAKDFRHVGQHDHPGGGVLKDLSTSSMVIYWTGQGDGPTRERRWLQKRKPAEAPPMENALLNRLERHMSLGAALI